LAGKGGERKLSERAIRRNQHCLGPAQIGFQRLPKVFPEPGRSVPRLLRAAEAGPPSVDLLFDLLRLRQNDQLDRTLSADHERQETPLNSVPGVVRFLGGHFCPALKQIDERRIRGQRGTQAFQRHAAAGLAVPSALGRELLLQALLLFREFG
jgi:hypothetical protein